MEYRRLGRTGVSVSKLCLGAMMFGDWGTKDHDESIRIIHRALDAGINFIDTSKQGALTWANVAPLRLQSRHRVSHSDERGSFSIRKLRIRDGLELDVETTPRRRLC